METNKIPTFDKVIAILCLTLIPLKTLVETLKYISSGRVSAVMSYANRREFSLFNHEVKVNYNSLGMYYLGYIIVMILVSLLFITVGIGILKRKNLFLVLFFMIILYPVQKVLLELYTVHNFPDTQYRWVFGISVLKYLFLSPLFVLVLLFVYKQYIRNKGIRDSYSLKYYKSIYNFFLFFEIGAFGLFFGHIIIIEMIKDSNLVVCIISLVTLVVLIVLLVMYSVHARREMKKMTIKGKRCRYFCILFLFIASVIMWLLIKSFDHEYSFLPVVIAVVLVNLFMINFGYFWKRQKMFKNDKEEIGGVKNEII